MPALGSELQELTDKIDPNLSAAQWAFIIGGYITVLSIRQNQLERDVVEGTDVPLEDLYDFEDGRMCIGADKLRQLLGNLGRRDLEEYVREAYDVLHASSPYRH